MSSQKESTLQSKYLQGLPDQGKQVFALTGELSAALSKWMGTHEQLVQLTHEPEKIMRGARAKQLCLTLAAAGPFLRLEQLLPATCMGIWLFVMDELTDEHDELADEHDNIHASLWEGFTQLASVSDSTPDAELPADSTLRPLAEALRNIQTQIQKQPLFEELRPELSQAIRDVVSGMKAEEDWNAQYRSLARPALLDLDTYLDEGAWQTTGTYPVCLVLLCALGDLSLRDHLPHLLEMSRQASICVRLSNDLRTYKWELAQGKINALGLVQRKLMSTQGLAAPDALARARQVVQERLDEAVKRCMELGAPEHPHRTTSRHAEQFITDLVAFVCDFYIHHDFHHVLLRQDGHDIDAGTSSDS